MPAHHPSLPAVPQPTRVFFDPFNSSSTGHQHDASRLSGSTSWRESRSYKLSHQFRDPTGRGGQRHLSDLVGAGSEMFKKDGRKDNGDWEQGAPRLREKGWQDIRALLGNGKPMSGGSAMVNVGQKQRIQHLKQPDNGEDCSKADSMATTNTTIADISDEMDEENLVDKDNLNPEMRKIFRGLAIYLNGSTAPLVSDHRLKQLFVQHGGNTSIALGRRRVTHVILGERAGGGLSATKIQKEVSTVRGKSPKYVTAQWVLDSIEKGARQPESRYVPAEIKNKIGGSRQRPVRETYMKVNG